MIIRIRWGIEDKSSTGRLWEVIGHVYGGVSCLVGHITSTTSSSAFQLRNSEYINHKTFTNIYLTCTYCRAVFVYLHCNLLSPLSSNLDAKNRQSNSQGYCVLHMTSNTTNFSNTPVSMPTWKHTIPAQSFFMNL
jgi:hypothetical protein